MKFFKFMITLLIALMMLAALMPTITAQESGDQVYVEATVVPDILYVRAGPSTSYAILGELRHGTVVGILARSPYNPAVQTWVYVQGGGQEGWISAAFLQFPENYVLVGVPERTVDGATTAPAAPGNTASVDVSSDALTAISSDFVNLREGPGLEFNVIRQYPPDTPLFAVGRNFNAVWIEVVVNGQRGWMFYALVDVDGNRNNLPLTFGTAPQPPATTDTTDTTTTETTTNTTTTVSFGEYPRNPNGTYNIPWGTAPGFVQTVKYGDGRISKNRNLGVAILYCVDGNGYVTTGSYEGGGIMVYHFTEPSQGIVFFATDDQINATAIPASGSALIHAEAGYALYRLPDGRFQMVGSNVSTFNFVWTACIPPF